MIKYNVMNMNMSKLLPVRETVVGLAFLSSSLTLGGCSVLGLQQVAKAGEANAKTAAHEQTIQGSSLKSHVLRGPKQEPIRGLTQQNTTPQYEAPVTDLGRVPSVADVSQGTQIGENVKRPSMKARKVDAFVAPLILPEFIDVVFGEMLQTPYVTGPKVADRKEVVQLRSSGAMKSSDFVALVSTALEEYGVRVVVENGAYHLIEDASLRGRMPEFIKGRARVRTRADLRPIIQFVEMEAIQTVSMVGFLQQALGRNNKKIKITANHLENYLILSGLPEDVNSALDVIEQLDELRYAGTKIRRYTPKYWNAKELTEELIRALRVEGWPVTSREGEKRTIYIMPVDYSNDLFVFTNSEAANRRVERWFKEFDRPINRGDAEKIHIYQVQNVDAELLVEIANAVLQGSGNSSRDGNGSNSSGTRGGTSTLSANRPNSPGSERAGGASRGGKFTVDKMGNRIIFTSTATEFDKMMDLLRQLDTPTPEVLIEVQIAEVSLSDNTNYGVQFFVDDLGSDKVAVTTKSSGLGLGSTGLTIGVLSGNVDASINAFASNRRVKILSTPILVARSGGQAEIQVGTDVPVITSQRAANNQNGTGNTDILQSIEYRSTGVLLSIEPIVFSDNRIDLTISQEVSSTIDVQNSSISSPTISNRSIHTQLSLQDGETAVLGGLIQETRIQDEKGIPLLKDIPIVGQVFSNDSISVDRTELVVLITAYVLRGQADKTQFVNYLSRRVDGHMTDNDRFETLLPKNF